MGPWTVRPGFQGWQNEIRLIETRLHLIQYFTRVLYSNVDTNKGFPLLSLHADIPAIRKKSYKMMRIKRKAINLITRFQLLSPLSSQ
jgi:hypothetical protein